MHQVNISPHLVLYLNYPPITSVPDSYPSGNTYSGEWKTNQRHGKGTMRWLNLGQKYVGAWQDGVQV